MDAERNERRRRFVFLTRNSEYHCFDRICVAVRDRKSGEWRARHPALRRRIEGGVKVFSNGAVIPSLHDPEIGDPMYFVLEHARDDQQLVTSRLELVDRPALADLGRYPKTG
jgi:hypothetical protein